MALSSFFKKEMEHVKDLIPSNVRSDDFPQHSNHSDVEHSYSSTVYQDFPDTATVDSDIRESQNDTIVQALEDLKMKIDRLEHERHAAQESLLRLPKYSLNNILPNLQENIDLDSSFIVQSNELESQLTMAETRCRTLEKQLEYIRTVMNSVQHDALQEASIIDEENKLIHNGSVFHPAIMLTQPNTQQSSYTLPSSLKHNGFAFAHLPATSKQPHSNSVRKPHINANFLNNENESEEEPSSQKFNKTSFMRNAAIQTSFLSKNNNDANNKNILFRPAVPLKPPQRLPDSTFSGDDDFSSKFLQDTKLHRKEIQETKPSNKEIPKTKPSTKKNSVDTHSSQSKVESLLPSKSAKPRSKFTYSTGGKKLTNCKPGPSEASNRSENYPPGNGTRSKSTSTTKVTSKSISRPEHKEKALIRLHVPKTKKHSQTEQKKPAVFENKREAHQQSHSRKGKIDKSVPKNEKQTLKSVHKSKINNHYHLNMADIPFVVGQCTGPSYSLPANIQGVISRLKNHNPQVCSDKAKRTENYTIGGTAASSLEDVLKMLEEEFQQMSIESGKLSQKLRQKEYSIHRQALTKRLNRTVQQLDAKSSQIVKLTELHDQMKSNKPLRHSAAERLTASAYNSEAIQIVTTVKPSVSGAVPIEVVVKKPNRKTLEHKDCPILGDKAKMQNENAKILQQMKHLQHSLNNNVIGKIT